MMDDLTKDLVKAYQLYEKAYDAAKEAQWQLQEAKDNLAMIASQISRRYAVMVVPHVSRIERFVKHALLNEEPK